MVDSRLVPKQTAMALKSVLVERCVAVSARWRPKPSRMRTVRSMEAMRAGMVRAGGSGWGSAGEGRQGVAMLSMVIPITYVRFSVKRYVGRADPGRGLPLSMCISGNSAGSAGRAITRWLTVQGVLLARRA